MNKSKIIQFSIRSLCLLGLLICITATATLTKKEIQFNLTGLPEPAATNVKTRLQIMLQNYDPRRKSNAGLQALAKHNIKNALAPFGYFSPTIDGRIHRDHRNWYVKYNIHTGSVVRVSAVHLQITGPGRSNHRLNQVLAHFPLKRGDPLRTSEYEKLKSDLFLTAESQGYLDSHLLNHEIIVDPHRHQADIFVTLDTGPRYYFGPVTFSKNSLDDAFLRRYLDFRSSDVFSYEKLMTLQDNLSGSNYFSHVEVIGSKKDAANYIIPVKVNLKDRKSQLYSFGIGYKTDLGFRALVGWDWRRLNRYGHYMTAVLGISQVQNSIVARYVIPGNKPVSDRYFITGAVQRDEFNISRSFIQQLGVSYQQQRGGWQRTFSMTYHRERSPQINNGPTTTVHYLLPALDMSYLRADKPYLPTKGIRLTANIRGASQSILSNTNFLQSEARVKWVLPFLGRKTRFILRGDLGLSASNKPTDLPQSLYFHTGGAQSVRGYKLRSLGPGRYMLTGSIELQPHIYKKWYGSIFYDVGNAFDEFPASLKRGAGIGVVWQSPIGPLQVTLAKALSLRGYPSRIQFSMGPLL